MVLKLKDGDVFVSIFVDLFQSFACFSEASVIGLNYILHSIILYANRHSLPEFPGCLSEYQKRIEIHLKFFRVFTLPGIFETYRNGCFHMLRVL